MAAFQRRRQHFRCSIPSVFAAAALALLLVLAVLSFLAPPLLDDPPSRILKRNDGDIRRHAINVISFHVPSRGSTRHDLWSSKLSKHYYGCSNASSKHEAAEILTYPHRYLMIATSGGLNQQRTGIIDAVVAARILNATLVVPKLDQRSFWKDASNFSEIFDVGWFISFLRKDVKIIKQLPVRGGKVIGSPYTMRVPRKCTPSCYQKRVLPVLMKKHIVQLTKFDYRLANKLTADLQKLRCRVNYHALRFTYPIVAMGDKLVKRMKGYGKRFIALHLRFEPDMLAFSGCYYGGGDKERRELGKIRKRWKTLHISDPEKGRRHGRCPLTPEEVGLLLRALGFGKEVHLYVASGEIYGGEETLAPLKALFPNFHTKDTLATKEELASFSNFSSRMAALDFMVCDESDVFVTNNNGNMAKILAGRRRYFGHKRTIRPNARKLYSLFLSRANITWEEFSSKVRSYQRGFMGDPKEVRPGRGEFHENPSTCICESREAKTDKESISRSHQKISSTDNEKWSISTNNGESSDDHETETEEDPDWADLDYGETVPLAKQHANGTDPEYNLFIRPEETELEELFSD